MLGLPEDTPFTGEIPKAMCREAMEFLKATGQVKDER